jgi:excisionase family DNA binding protein
MTDTAKPEWTNLPLVLTTQQVADLLQVDHRTITNYCQRGQIKAFKIGKHWRITREALLNFVELPHQE